MKKILLYIFFCFLASLSSSQESDILERGLRNANLEISKTYFYDGVKKGKLGDFREAIQDFNNAIENSPNYADPYLSRGVAKANLGDYRGAILDYDKYILLNSYFLPNDNFLTAYICRADAKREIGDNIGAIQDYNKALEIKPYDRIALNNRGIAKINLGDINGGCLDLSRAGELGSKRAYDAIKNYCN
jgi:tetratricopeptide (TPR) repeat protein